MLLGHLGLDRKRLAMVLFDIPDIRLFWSTDERFTSQFSSGRLGLKFKPFSKYPFCYKDMSFWISDSFAENKLCEVVRGIAGDLAEEVKLIGNFTNKKGMTSHCYRIAYRSTERSLTDEEINDLQWKVREQVDNKLKEKNAYLLTFGVLRPICQGNTLRGCLVDCIGIIHLKIKSLMR